MVLIAAAIALGSWPLLPPAPLDAGAPKTAFSAARAMDHVRTIAAEPHMIGSAANDRVRAYLLAELEALGLEVETQAATVVYDHPASEETRPRVAWPINVLARLRGASDAPAIALMSHYDSVPTAPGAADAGSGVATLLETIRAFIASPAIPRRDILLVITDGEEIGLMGAQSFFGEHRWAENLGLILNFEARGASGPAQMFQTGPDNAGLIAELAAIAPYPVANSVSGEIYRRMPNDTDASIALGKGTAFMNFAFIDDLSRYHAPTDRPEHLSLRSLQHEGANALALLTHFAQAEALPTAQADATYFNLGARLLVHYRKPVVLAVAAVASLAALAALIFGWHRQRYRVGDLLGGLVALAAATLGAFWLVQGMHHWVGTTERPFAVLYRYQFQLAAALLLTLVVMAGLWSTRGGVRRITALAAAGAIAAMAVVLPEIGLGALAAIAALLLHAWIAPRTDAVGIWAVTLALWAALAVLVAIAAPHASYLFSWPLLAGSLAALWCWHGSVAADRPGTVLPGALGLCVAGLLWSALVYGAYLALGISMPGLVAALVVPPAAFGAALLASLAPAVLVVLLVAAMGLFGWIGLSNPYDEAHPRPSSLFYAVDADRQQAWWASELVPPPQWAREQVPPTDVIDASEWFPDQPRSWPAGPAPLLDVEASRIEPLALSDDEDGFRLRLRLRASGTSDRIELFLPAADYTRAVIDGHAAPLPGSGANGLWRWSLYGPPGSMEILLEGTGPAPDAIRVTDIDYGWPEAVASAVPERPAYTMAPPWSLSDSTVHTQRVSLTPPALVARP